MNEITGNNMVFINNVCRVCLNTTKYLSTMSNEHIKLYINLVDKITHNEYAMNICMICKWMLQKFASFKNQCLAANSLLHEATNMMDSKSLSSQNTLINSHDMVQTSLSILTYNPSLDHTLHDITHCSIHTHNTQNDIHIASCNTLSVHTKTYKKDDNHSNDDQCFVDTFVNDYTTENDKYMNETINDTYDNYDDEDEIPLVLISGSSRKRTKKKSKMKRKLVEEMVSPNENSEESVVKEENESKKEEKSKRSKKALKDGFSSRMVQETSEYVVIKLTKEQVIQEMTERSKTDAYVSSPYKCEKCVKGFNFQDVLDTHMEKHSLKNGTFSCDMCGQCCPSAVSLRGHIKSHTTRYKCKICGTVRVSRQHLMEHHAAHSGSAPHYQCLQCTFTTNKRTVMQRHARGHAQREPHACDTCGKLFKNIHYLRLHAARHDKSSRYQCPQCPATFLYHSLRSAHVRSAHERGELYCVECDLRFKCAESLRVHFKKAKRHRLTTTMTHSCTECACSFGSARSLATHLSTHAVPKLHACQHCNSTYRTRNAVRSHIWRVHKRGDARADCPHCHANFSRKSLLKAHLYSRTACGARRRSPQDDIHEKSQNEELPQYENKIEV